MYRLVQYTDFHSLVSCLIHSTNTSNKVGALAYAALIAARQQVPPMRERADDRQEFSIIHVVIAFRWIQGLGVVSHCLEFSPIIPLV